MVVLLMPDYNNERSKERDRGKAIKGRVNICSLELSEFIF